MLAFVLWRWARAYLWEIKQLSRVFYYRRDPSSKREPAFRSRSRWLLHDREYRGTVLVAEISAKLWNDPAERITEKTIKGKTDDKK